MEMEKQTAEAILVAAHTLRPDMLDALIRELAHLRSSTLPAVAATKAALLATGAEVLVQDKPVLHISVTLDGFRLWLRHEGLGWIAYQIDRQVAANMADFLRTRVLEASPFVGDEFTHIH